MAKVTYISVVKKALVETNDRLGVIEALKEAFPDVSSTKLIAKLNAAIKYIKANEKEVK